MVKDGEDWLGSDANNEIEKFSETFQTVYKGVFTWFVMSQTCSKWCLKWAKDSEQSRKANHKKLSTTF